MGHLGWYNKLWNGPLNDIAGCGRGHSRWCHRLWWSPLWMKPQTVEGAFLYGGTDKFLFLAVGQLLAKQWFFFYTVHTVHKQQITDVSFVKKIFCIKRSLFFSYRATAKLFTEINWDTPNNSLQPEQTTFTWSSLSPTGKLWQSNGVSEPTWKLVVKSTFG